jgi:GR25 family glycosyltransferase involved in LPS biosynthesis
MKSFIIHLSKIPSSLESAQQLQTDLKNINIDAELFEGTYGSDVEEIFEKEGRTLHYRSFKGVAPDEHYISKTNRPGVKGCFYSHYRLWQKCAELDEPICVFEDDVKIERALIPVDFKDVLVITLGARKSYRYEEFLYNPIGIPAAQYYHNASMPGTCGYLINPCAARKLLAEYKTSFLPSDNAMNKMVVDIEIHNYLVGAANLDKRSLTRSKGFWDKFNK